MTPQARIAAAIALLDSIASSDYPADRVAATFLRRRRYVGAKDRRAILDMVYRVIRAREALDWWLARAGGTAPFEARPRLLALLALGEGSAPGEIAGLFSGGDYGPPPLAPEEGALVARLAGDALGHPDQPERVRANCPEWIAAHLMRRFGAGFARELAALNQEAPFDLRVNTLKVTREEARAALAGEGVTAAATPYSPFGLRVARRTPIAGLDAYKRGFVEIQDEGSQIVALMTDARPGQRVVDFCAGGGGKALALAAIMENRGEVAALDVSPRIARALPRIERSGASIVATHRLADEDPWLAAHRAAADRVLVDAPCTGTGAWRRDPAARFRLTPDDLERFAAAQRQILGSAAALVKPGGRLIYATCSLLAAEDEAQADWFAEAHPDFAVLPAAAAWDETVGGSCPAAGPYLLLTPAANGTDGFFVALFERKGG